MSCTVCGMQITLFDDRFAVPFAVPHPDQSNLVNKNLTTISAYKNEI